MRLVERQAILRRKLISAAREAGRLLPNNSSESLSERRFAKSNLLKDVKNTSDFDSVMKNGVLHSADSILR